MIALPFAAGADHVTVACWVPAEPTTDVGVPGVVNGVADALATDHDPCPTAFRAAIRNTYDVPFTNAVTMFVVVDTPVLVDQFVQLTPLFDEYWIA